MKLAAAIAVLCAVTATAQVRERDSEWTAPSGAAARTNPLAHRADAAAGGVKLFQQRCAACHGEDGRGTTKGPDLASAATQSQTDGELFWKIGSGNTRRDMPAFSNLPELQRWQLVLKLRQLHPER
jgi:mono/diheme cytochrome c family protein